jgi:hypothetical protein
MYLDQCISRCIAKAMYLETRKAKNDLQFGMVGVADKYCVHFCNIDRSCIYIKDTAATIDVYYHSPLHQAELHHYFACRCYWFLRVVMQLETIQVAMFWLRNGRC